MGSSESCSTRPAAAKLPEGFKGSYGTMYYVRDMKKATAFYRDTIGLVPAMEDEGWTQFDLNGHALCLHPAGEKKITQGGGVLIIEVADIRKVVNRLKEKRVEFHGDINDMGECGLCAEFQDLDGNVLSVYQAPTHH